MFEKQEGFEKEEKILKIKEGEQKKGLSWKLNEKQGRKDLTKRQQALCHKLSKNSLLWVKPQANHIFKNITLIEFTSVIEYER